MKSTAAQKRKPKFRIPLIFGLVRGICPTLDYLMNHLSSFDLSMGSSNDFHRPPWSAQAWLSVSLGSIRNARRKVTPALPCLAKSVGLVNPAADHFSMKGGKKNTSRECQLAPLFTQNDSLAPDLGGPWRTSLRRKASGRFTFQNKGLRPWGHESFSASPECPSKYTAAYWSLNVGGGSMM